MMPQAGRRGQGSPGRQPALGIELRVSGFVLLGSAWGNPQHGSQRTVLNQAGLATRSRAWWIERNKARWVRQPTINFASDTETGL